MDANRDEAERCLKIAEKHLNQRNFDEARRFVEKAKRLYSKADISKFSALFNEREARKPSRSPSRERTPNSNNFSAKSPYTQSANDGNSSANRKPSFGKSQTDPIRKILACKDYYQILGVTNNCSVDEIKKAYRVLALKYHPDKNQTPGATEAFKKIGKAFDTLSDAAKRKRYDDCGNEDEAPVTYTRRNQGDVFYQYEAHQGYDADFFNMFFGGAFPFAQFNHTGRHHRRQPRQAQESERESNYFVYLQLLPLVILFALSFFSNMMVREPYYNLQRTQKYNIERVTQNYHVPYFVKTTFGQDFDGSLTQLERQIEEEYVNNLRFRCYREKEHKETMMYRARYYGDDDAFLRAQKISVPACDQLNQIFNAAQGG